MILKIAIYLIIIIILYLVFNRCNRCNNGFSIGAVPSVGDTVRIKNHDYITYNLNVIGLNYSASYTGLIGIITEINEDENDYEITINNIYSFPLIPVINLGDDSIVINTGNANFDILDCDDICDHCHTQTLCNDSDRLCEWNHDNNICGIQTVEGAAPSA